MNKGKVIQGRAKERTWNSNPVHWQKKVPIPRAFTAMAIRRCSSDEHE